MSKELTSIIPAEIVGTEERAVDARMLFEWLGYDLTSFNKSFERPIKNANLLENEDWALLGLLSENSNVGGRPQKNGDIYS